MRNPTGQAPEGKQNGEHVRREAHGLVNDARVEVNVRVELALNEELVIQGHFFEAASNIEQRVRHVKRFEDFVRGLLDDRGARVVVLVDAVPKSHELDAVFAILDLADEGIHSATSSVNVLEHVENGLVGSTVQWAEERVNTGRDRSKHVGVR